MSPAAMIALVAMVACGGAHLSAPQNAIPATSGNFIFADGVGGSHGAFVYHPTSAPAAGIPWVLYAPTFVPGGTPDIELADDGYAELFRAAGLAFAGINIGESYGAPPGRAIFTSFYNAMLAAGYSSTPALLARSRGGLMLYEWAADNPSKVSCIAAVYAAADLASYPGLSNGSLQAAWSMSQAQLEVALPTINPIERLAPMAAAGVTSYAVAGDSDLTVPMVANSEVVATRLAGFYGETLGDPVVIDEDQGISRRTVPSGRVVLDIVAGAGHSGFEQQYFFNQALVDFVIANAE